ncbi:MAG: hypothetical protein ACXVCV_07375, partial [Polyangia bacterium]
MTSGRPLLVALASLTACSSGTSVLVRVSAPKPLASLSAEASVDAVNKTGQWTMPALPATLVLQLADVSVDVDLMISAVDVTGDSMVQRASVRSSPHHQVTLDVMLTPTAGGDGGAIGDGSADGAADDLANADLSPTVIALRSAAKASVLNLSPLSISQPSGTSPGDVLVAAVYLGYGTAGSLPTITPSVGWTLVERVDYSTTGSLVLYWRVAGTSEPASYAWSSSGGQNTSGVGWIGAYTGVD